MGIRNFETIESWVKSRDLVKDIYSITRHSEFRKDFSLKDQVRRSAVSIMSNIAEGFDSGSNKSFIRYLNISLGSASEVKSLLYIALDQNYIKETEFNKLHSKCDDIINLIRGFKKYLNKNL
jgi:four helix bundle protein